MSTRFTTILCKINEICLSWLVPAWLVWQLSDPLFPCLRWRLFPLSAHSHGADMVPGILGFSIRKSSTFRSQCFPVSGTQIIPRCRLTHIHDPVIWEYTVSQFSYIRVLRTLVVLFLATFVVMGVAVRVFADTVYAYACLRASRTIHNQLAGSILGTTLRYFLSN